MSASAVPPTMPVAMVAFLDLVAELIATAVWQEQGESPAAGESVTTSTLGCDAPTSSASENVGPIPSFPADSHPHSRPRPTTPRRGTRRAPPREMA
jgi:hypothetical protein